MRIEAPKKFHNKILHLSLFIKENNPIAILEKFSGRRIKQKVAVKHKILGQEARFRKNIIFVDFNNNIKYLWLSICHELAHIILENPPWYERKDIADFVKKYKGFRSKKYKYKFHQAIEQTLTILLQAACEQKVGIRKLVWKEWELTFDYMEVKDYGKKLWKDWLLYLKNTSRYRNIDEWILKMLEKYF